MTELAPGLKIPRSVLVASDTLYLRLVGDPSSIHLLQKVDAMVVPYSLSPQFHDRAVVLMREHLDRSGQLSEGSILVKNPYDADSFELAENAIGAFAAEKYRALAKVAALLGAVDVSFREARVESQQSNWSANVRARFKVADGSADAKRQVKKQVTSRIDAHLTFPGGSPSPEAALDYLERRNISHDRDLAALIELRSGPYPVLSYEMKLNGTRESESNLQCALDLANAGPVKVLKVGATFARTAKFVKDVEISTKIRFPSSTAG